MLRWEIAWDSIKDLKIILWLLCRKWIGEGQEKMGG